MEYKEVHDRVYDLSSTRDLNEIEAMCSKPDKFKILVDETLLLPFRHIRFEIIREKKE